MGIEECMMTKVIKRIWQHTMKTCSRKLCLMYTMRQANHGGVPKRQKLWGWELKYSPHLRRNDSVGRTQGGKCTTDFKNKMIKKSGKPLIQAIVPLIETVWAAEEIPAKWNHGLIISLGGQRNAEESHRYHSIICSRHHSIGHSE